MAFVSYENLIQYNGLLEEDIAKKYTPSESGKGLSSNDYTNTDKNKLNDIEDNAEVNIVETIKVNGNALSVSDKAVDISVPTKASDINALPDTTSIPDSLSDLSEDTTHRVVTDTEKTYWNSIEGKIPKSLEDLASKSGEAASEQIVSALGYTPANEDDIPTSLPANGGNSNTVNNHTIESDVPSGVAFEVISASQPSSQEVGDTWLKLV